MCSCIRLTYLNTANVSLQVIVWMDLMNAGGQTVGIGITMVTLQAGQSLTVDNPIVAGLPHGTYTAMIIATTVSGVVVAGPVTCSFSV